MSELPAIRTPLLTYTHPDYNNRIDLVGMMHVGEADYYQRVQEFTDGRFSEGAAIHYERLKPHPEEQLAEIPRSLLHKYKAIELAIGPLAVYLCRTEGVVQQKDALNYHPDWMNYDVARLDVASYLSRLDIAKMRLQVSGLKLLGSVIGRGEIEVMIWDQLKKGTNELLKNLNNEEAETTAGSDSAASNKRSKVSKREDYFVNTRNDIALAGVAAELETNPTKDIVLLWGSGHLKGLSEGLKARGFEFTNLELLTAIEARSSTPSESDD